jgi:hypothetical protein
MTLEIAELNCGHRTKRSRVESRSMVGRDRWARRNQRCAPSQFDKLRVLSRSKDGRALPQSGDGITKSVLAEFSD